MNYYEMEQYIGNIFAFIGTAQKISYRCLKQFLGYETFFVDRTDSIFEDTTVRNNNSGAKPSDHRTRKIKQMVLKTEVIPIIPITSQREYITFGHRPFVDLLVTTLTNYH